MENIISYGDLVDTLKRHYMVRSGDTIFEVTDVRFLYTNQDGDVVDMRKPDEVMLEHHAKRDVSISERANG